MRSIQKPIGKDTITKNITVTIIAPTTTATTIADITNMVTTSMATTKPDTRQQTVIKPDTIANRMTHRITGYLLKEKIAHVGACAAAHSRLFP